MKNKYRIFETDRFRKDLRLIARGRSEQIGEKLRSFAYPLLREEPRFGPNIKRLRGFDPSVWRYRIADWRFFYSIDDEKKLVSMLAADHRRQAYRR